MTTPPGWYPDPVTGQTGNSPTRERWWDGIEWTSQTRSRSGARAPLVAGVVGVLVLLGALMVGAVLIFGPGSGPRSTGRSEAGDGGAPTRPPTGAPPTAPPPSAPAPPGHHAPGHQEPAPPSDPDLPDRGTQLPATGVDLPVLRGWTHDPDGPMVSRGPYQCPGGQDDDSCLRGAAALLVADEDSDSGTEQVAESDIKRYAKKAYDKATYGGISSHKVLTAGKTEVAGQDAYRVRWKIVNRRKPDAYVESVAFRHPDGSGEMLVLRAGFDIHAGAPPLSDMDKLAKGVIQTAPDGTGDAGGTRV
jgi:hypothetical protein